MTRLNELSQQYHVLKGLKDKLNKACNDSWSMVTKAERAETELLDKVSVSLTTEEWKHIIDSAFEKAIDESLEKTPLSTLNHYLQFVHRDIISGADKMLLEKKVQLLERERKQREIDSAKQKIAHGEENE
jgi:hypothetical protein